MPPWDLLFTFWAIKKIDMPFHYVFLLFFFFFFLGGAYMCITCIRTTPNGEFPTGQLPPRQFPRTTRRVLLSKQKEWICSLFKEWILEKSEIRVNFEWNWSEHLCYSLILEWPQGSLGIPEWSLRSLQNEWITQMFTPNSL